MTRTVALEHAAVVGAGAVGEMIAAMLLRSGVRAERFDLRPRPSVVGGDACAPTGALHTALERADVVVLALPEEILQRALPGLPSVLRADALVVETASVKEPFEAILQEGMGARETIGINPMFAPSVGARGQSVAIVRRRPTAAGDAFLAMLEAEGARLVELDAERHDRMAAAMQSLTHASILAFASALKAIGEPIDVLLDLAPPPFRVLAALAARIVGQSRDTYWDIQSKNANAARMRTNLGEALQRVDAAVANGDRDAFAAMLDDIEMHQGATGQQLRESCAALFATLPTHNKRAQK